MKFLVINKVLGTSQAGGGDYQTTTSGTNHAIELDQEGLPKGATAQAAWYYPIDNLVDIPAFHTIDINVVANDTLNLGLKQQDQGRQGLLRIKIIVAYE